jgi:hypothetical protein
MPRRRDNTAKFAKALWTFEALDLEAAEFQRRFDALYATAEGPATFWQLGGAANDYLRHHPGSIVVPSELAPALLASTMADGRIIGLKLLNRCSTDVTAIITAICRALESRHEGEMCGGMCELENLLDRLEPSARLPVQELRLMLGKLSSWPDPYVPTIAERIANRLGEFAAA